MNTRQPSPEAFDEALQSRLGKLGGMPMDTSRLDRAMRTQIPPVPARRRWFAPLVAAAASLLIVATVGIALLQGREVQASAGEMAQMHEDIVSGKIPTMHADSIDDANRAIAAMAGNFPTLPQPPASHTMSCCMRNVRDKKVACVLLDNGGTPVTMAIADSANIESPKSPTRVYNGMTYHVQTVGKLTMVMTERQHRWICLIGEVPEERLIALAEGLKF